MFLHHRSFSESVHVFLPVLWDSLFKLRRGYHGPLICLAEGLYSLQGPYLLKKKAQGRCNEKRSALRRSRIWNPENDSLSCSMATYCGISHTKLFIWFSFYFCCHYRAGLCKNHKCYILCFDFTDWTFKSLILPGCLAVQFIGIRLNCFWTLAKFLNATLNLDFLS